MSKQSTNIYDHFQNMNLDEIRNMVNNQKQELKKDYKERRERIKLINQYKKLTEAREKVRQGIDIKKEIKKTKPKPKKVVISESPPKPKIKTKNKFSVILGPPPKTPPKPKKVMSFDEYFEECIRNKKIPKDTPPYLRKALERAILEYDQGLEKETFSEYDQVLEKEKSAFENFATKYTIQGIPGLNPKQYFAQIYKTLRDFFTNHRDIKFRIHLVTNMEKQKNDKIVQEDKSYFTSGNLNNMKSTDVDYLIRKSLNSIQGGLEEYQNNGSDWRFKGTDKLEIHTVEYNPTKGSSYIPLPDWISNKKAIVNIQNKDEKCFLWSILRYLHPKERDEYRLTGLKEYEFSLNTKGITFPMKIKDITKFEKLNPELPGINVFSVDENKKFYPLRMAERVV